MSITVKGEIERKGLGPALGLWLAKMGKLTNLRMLLLS